MARIVRQFGATLEIGEVGPRRVAAFADPGSPIFFRFPSSCRVGFQQSARVERCICRCIRQARERQCLFPEPKSKTRILSRPLAASANRAAANGPAQRAWPAALRMRTARRHSVCCLVDGPSSSTVSRGASSRACWLLWRVKVSRRPRYFQVLRPPTIPNRPRRANPRRQRCGYGARRSHCDTVRLKPILRAAASSPHLLRCAFILERRLVRKDEPAFCPP